MLAFAYSQSGDNESAIKYLNQAIQIYPGYRDAVVTLNNIYISQNRKSEAMQLLGNYLKNNPSDHEIEKIYKSLGDSLHIR
jgi:tetratricopeptide (TPR) repeat protein